MDMKYSNIIFIFLIELFYTGNIPNCKAQSSDLLHGKSWTDPIQICNNQREPFITDNSYHDCIKNSTGTVNCGCLSNGDTRSMWYKLIVASPGVLEFVINSVPANLSDYDFAVWKEPSENDGPSEEPERCNYKNSTSATGLKGIDNNNTNDAIGNPFSNSIEVEEGDVVYILINNNDNSIGYSIDFDNESLGIFTTATFECDNSSCNSCSDADCGTYGYYSFYSYVNNTYEMVTNGACHSIGMYNPHNNADNNVHSATVCGKFTYNPPSGNTTGIGLPGISDGHYYISGNNSSVKVSYSITTQDCNTTLNCTATNDTTQFTCTEFTTGGTYTICKTVEVDNNSTINEICLPYWYTYDGGGGGGCSGNILVNPSNKTYFCVGDKIQLFLENYSGNLEYVFNNSIYSFDITNCSSINGCEFVFSNSGIYYFKYSEGGVCLQHAAFYVIDQLPFEIVKFPPCIVSDNCPISSYQLNNCEKFPDCLDCDANFNGSIFINISNYLVDFNSDPSKYNYVANLYKYEDLKYGSFDPNSYVNKECDDEVIGNEACGKYLYASQILEYSKINEVSGINFINLGIGKYNVEVIRNLKNNSSGLDPIQGCNTYYSEDICLELNRIVEIGDDAILYSMPNNPVKILTIEPQKILDYIPKYSNYTWYKVCNGDQPIAHSEKLSLKEGDGGLYYLEATINNGCTGKDYVQVSDLNLPHSLVTDIDKVISGGYTEYEHTWTPVLGSIPWNSTDEISKYMHTNPYLSGIAGLYKPSSSFDYLNKRERTTGSSPNLSKVTGNPDGIYNNMPLPLYNNPSFQSCNPLWIKNNAISSYNPQSFELESKDILGNKSAAIYGLKGTQPIAVASNAGYNEIAYENFEELTATATNLNNTPNNFEFALHYTEGNVPTYQEFIIRNGMANHAMVDRNLSSVCGTEPFVAHVFASTIPTSIGQKSVGTYTSSYQTKLTDIPTEFINPLHIIQGTGLSKYKILEFDKGVPGFNPDIYNCSPWQGKLLLETTYYMKGQDFTSAEVCNSIAHTGNQCLKVSESTTLVHPDIHLIPNTKYVFSCWVHTDNHDNLTPESFFNTPLIRLEYSNSNVQHILYPRDNTINGWQRLEITFETPIDPKGFKTTLLSMSNDGNSVYYDDIRIFPFNANMQTYVYDPSNYRLLATLDQNNYATFYQYDEQGNLFSTKKETTEGIKTLQTSNSYIKK